MVQQHARFSSDDEIIAFLRRFEKEDKNLTRLIGRMKDAGVLVELAGEWTPPPFLSEFIEKLSERHVLASPSVIRGWIETLTVYISELLDRINSATYDPHSFDLDASRILLRQIDELFYIIVRTVQDNCAQIASAVADYRKTEDSGHLRTRLARLIHLHNQYLEPIIRIVHVKGEFHAVTEQISTCCSRLRVLGDERPNNLNEEAHAIQKDVRWLRRAVVRQADEARRELAPLCEGAVRESKIAKGVSRALEAIDCGQWQYLDLEKNLIVVEEKDPALLCDRAIKRFLKDVVETTSRPPPQVPLAPPTVLPIPIVVEDLLNHLDEIEPFDDLLRWILDSYHDIHLDAAVQLFHNLLERRTNQVGHTDDRLDYERGNLSVNVARWFWKGQGDDNRQFVPDDGRFS
jgi:hypothetical protein